VVLATGTSSPDPAHTPEAATTRSRLPFAPPDISGARHDRVLFLAMLAALRVGRGVTDPRRLRTGWQALGTVRRRAGAIGWTQYLTGVPELLVGLHLAGATALWRLSSP
jgi:cytochrome c oxidase assembly protein subunit 15